MISTQERQANQAAYRRLKDSLAKNYAKGQFIAIAGEEIVADAPRLGELRTMLEKSGKDPRQVLVVQAGVDHPESGVILFREIPAVSSCIWNRKIHIRARRREHG